MSTKQKKPVNPQPQRFKVSLEGEALATHKKLQAAPKRYATILKAVESSLRFLGSNGPNYPSLHSKPYEAADVVPPHGRKVFESYAQNDTPGAWRIFWYYGGEHREPGPPEVVYTVIAVFLIRPHSNNGRLGKLPRDLR